MDNLKLGSLLWRIGLFLWGDMMQILFKDIFDVGNVKDFKVHCAVWNSFNQPLDCFARDKAEWFEWNAYKGQKNEFNRRYIFSMMNFYHETDTWLFGGVYEVFGIKGDFYDIKLVDMGAEFIGRLKIHFKRTGRNIRLKMENCIDDFVVSEILAQPYTGQSFVGYEDINIGFSQLETIIKNEKPDWRAALQNVKGIYLITDTNNGKRYVGSAYGETGVWSRWSCYMATGHGYNDELTKLIKQEGLEYARQHFRFALLEYRSMRVDDKAVIERESYWKEVLLTRGEWGYNQN